MKTLFIALVSLFCMVESFAQTASIKQKVMDETCGCIKKIDLEADEKTVKEAMGMCLLTTVAPSIDALLKEMGYAEKDLENEGVTEEVMRKIMQEMATNCPHFLSLAMKFNKNGNENEQEEETEKPAYDGSVRGKLQNIKAKNFTILELKDDTGIDYQLIWLNRFKGDDVLVHATKGQTLILKWRVVEIYDYKKKQYNKYNEIVSAEAPKF